MSRIVITSPLLGYKKGDVVEASAALVAALGANARAVTAGGASPSQAVPFEPVQHTAGRCSPAGVEGVGMR